jgi:putative hydrolase of the HAD superfamily
MPMIRAILFDLDNTLLDRDASFRDFACKLADAYADAAEESREDWIGRVIEWDEDGYKDKRQLFRDVLERLPCRPAAGWEELYAYYRVHYVESAVPMAGMKELLSALRPYYRLGIVTNGSDSIQNGKIDKLGIRSWFGSVVVSETAGINKPSPLIFARALAELDIKPEQALFVGDHPVNDVEGALLSGMRAVWLKRNQPWRESIAVMPDAVISSLAELPEAIRLAWGQTASSKKRLP